MKFELFFTYLFIIHAESAKILGIFPAPGYSQFILAEVLMTELAKRGHEVTVISPYRPEDEPKNYKTILTEEALESGSNFDLFEIGGDNLFRNIMATYIFGNEITDYTFQNREVQKLIKSKEKFDLVIVEQFFNDAMKGFATHFKAPLVLFSSMGTTEWNKEYMGNPVLPTITAVSYTSYTNHMVFLQRIKNLIGTVFDYLYRHYVFYPVQRKLLKNYFPETMNFDEIITNASLMLMNSHPTTTENSLLPYNMVEIGGFHVIGKPLDANIKNFLDSATKGAILFSLGSNLKSSDLSKDTTEAIFRVFERLDQKVLWKFEADVPNKPKNVLISKWLKQRDILAHPNVKLFITHGGMLSTTEAIFNAVPMIGIPVFADQKMNIARAKSKGIALQISLEDLTEEALFLAINETLNNPMFSNNVRRISSMLKDRPVKPLDLAIYWLEYTIRHNGFKFESASSKLYWFELYMADIVAFIAVNVILLYAFTTSILFFVKKFCSSVDYKITKNTKIKNQ